MKLNNYNSIKNSTLKKTFNVIVHTFLKDKYVSIINIYDNDEIK